MQQNSNRQNPDGRTRFYVALLLVTPYTVLLLMLPFVPAARDALIILGPIVGYTVRYLFELPHRRRP
jgi:hypothetical protein